MDYIWGLGRRKSSVARVRIRPGSGKININGQELAQYFSLETERQNAIRPMVALDLCDSLDVSANLKGGGKTGQAGAMLMGLARALKTLGEEHEGVLREHGFLTRDPRMKERKKPGKKGARASYQFSKR